MKKLFVSFMTLFVVLTSNAGTTDDVRVLQSDSLRVYGNMVAMMNQRIETMVFNTSATDDYEGRWYVLDISETTGRTLLMDTLVSIKANADAYFSFTVRVPEGLHCLLIAADREGRQGIVSCFGSFSPLRRLNIQSSIAIEMLSRDANPKVLASDRLKGSVSLRCEEEYSGCHDENDETDGIWLWLDEADGGNRLHAERITDKMAKYGQGVFAFDLPVRLQNEGHYCLHVGYMAPNGLVETSAEAFTVRVSDVSCWTADGRVQSLPIDDSGIVRVPEEAVAVDLRGMDLESEAVRIDVSQANPNCLYYADKEQMLPEGLGTGLNLIQGGVAQNVMITEGHDYYCPESFTATYVSYLMKPIYSPETGVLGRYGYSETLVLPFDVAHVCLYDVNAGEETLHADMLRVMEYWGNQGDSLNVVPVRQFKEMRAYTPYILGVYVGTHLLFSAENTLVPMTRPAVSRGQDFWFVGSTTFMQLSSVAYVYDPSDGCFHRDDGVRLAPFRAYIIGVNVPTSFGDNVETLGFSPEAWGEKGLPGVPKAMGVGALNAVGSRNRTAVFTLGGRPECQSGTARSEKKEGLSSMPAVYIVNGRKQMVR